ncbi:MAG: hypothetical protein KIS92_16510 [Planctomycetota bacterium]|nr:hypothetical protein [Planctomycetota bacterium]
MKLPRTLAVAVCAVCSLAAWAGESAAPSTPSAPSPTADPGVAARKKIMRERFLPYFMLGTTAPIEWFNETRDKNGAKWDFNQHYFSGGAQKGWDMVFYEPYNKWVNPDKVKGVWGDKILKSNIENNYIPWITMYNLAQSQPAEYKPGPAQATPRNAAVTSTMKAYWEQVRLIMKLCDKYKPAPIVIHVEPDEWGHMLLGGPHQGKNLDPLTVDCKVGSTGLEELKDLPDNLKGYSEAWFRMRALYAPYNVILATNPSAWDWQGSMSGSRWVKYFKECGADKWDLAVLEFGDRDLGCHGKGPPYTEADFVTRFKSYDKMLEWIKELHDGTGLWVVMWQVAVGNTYFSACNQTDGHYCDGIAQSLLEDYPKNPLVSRFANAGCLGFVFSPGQGMQTHVHDAKKDGITNPTPIPGNLGNTSEYADDDGGYMRLRAGSYYKQPYKIMGPVTETASAKPAAGGETNASPAKATLNVPAAAAPPPLPKVDAKDLAAYDAKLRAKLAATLKDGKKVNAFIKLFGAKDTAKEYGLAGVDDGGLKVNVQGNKMPVKWDGLALADRAMLAKGLLDLDEEDAEANLLAGFYFLADGQQDKGEQFLAKASAKDASAVQEARKALGLAK